MSDPAIKTRPFRHQQEIYDAQRDSSWYALFHEMGLGKTKIIVDVASHLHMAGRIDGLLIVAPNSVYSNWITQELPVHMATPYVKLLFRSSEKGDKARMRRNLFLSQREWIGRLRVLCMSYDAIRTDHGRKLADDFCALFKVMIVADESTAIKNGSTVTSKAMKKIRQHCHYAWIATGTPIAQSPFDVHSQIEFLSPSFWKNHGMRSYAAFKTHFGVYEIRRAGQRVFSELTAYRDMDELHDMIKSIASRLLKEDSTVELPPKLYKTIMFKLSSEQRRVYDALRKEYVAELEAGGGVIEAPLAIVRLTRLQQISSGFVTVEPGVSLARPGRDAPEFVEREIGVEPEEVFVDYEQAMREANGPLFGADPTLDIHQDILPDVLHEMLPMTPSEKQIVDVVPPSENPRLRLLVELVDQCSHKVIIWCRFTRDVEIVCETLGDRVARYDGKTSRKERESGLIAFRDPTSSKTVFVANVHSISQGVTLTIAKTMIYYSNSFSPEKRLQSEDRFHRIGQDSSVLIVDLVAEDTVDERLIETLRKKYDLSAQVMGDRYREWIQPATRNGDQDD